VAVLETRDLTYYYGRTIGVEALNLAVDAGEVFGFLGPNGAGKTTTIRLLLDLIRPTRGEAMLFGRPAGVSSGRGRVGYLPGELVLDGRLTGARTLAFLAALGNGGDPSRITVRRAELCERLGLGVEDLARRVREYSRGMKQKLGLVAALQHDPDLLVLDEPTTGLDPLVRETVFELMAEARRAGRTVFHSSHVLSEVGRTCDRVAMLRDGRLAGVLRVDEIRRAAARTMVVDFGGDVPLDALTEAGATVQSAEAGHVVLGVRDVNPVLQLLAQHDVRYLAFPEPGLEDVFDELYAGTGGGRRPEEWS
jgi:ABC-2 type transport system ATP-binding protein